MARRLTAVCLQALLFGVLLISIPGAALAQASPDDEINPKKLDRQLLTRLIVKYTNEKRREHDLQPVKPNADLARLARKHSADMAEGKYFSHTTRNESGDVPFSKRVELEELGFRRTAENIALQPVVESKRVVTRTSPSGEETRNVTKDVSTYRELARKTVKGWMESPGHRKNLLTPEFNRIGIGVAVGKKDGSPYVYITQDFGQTM